MLRETTVLFHRLHKLPVPVYCVTFYLRYSAVPGIAEPAPLREGSQKHEEIRSHEKVNTVYDLPIHLSWKLGSSVAEPKLLIFG